MAPLDLTLPMAGLIPDCVGQALELDLFDLGPGSLLSPLDALKAWLRGAPLGDPDGLRARVAEWTLGGEARARREAEAAGLRFDPLEYELRALQDDPEFDRFDPFRCAGILGLVIDEADELSEYSRREFGCEFGVDVSLRLPDPRRHPRFSAAAIAAAWGAPPRTRPSLEGAFQVDLYPLGGRPSAPPEGPIFVEIPCQDARVGDATCARLGVVFPRESEGYFALSLRAMTAALSLASSALNARGPDAP